MANIREIARMAGVSVSTVSRVLNNHPYVSEEKRDAVWRTVEKLDYSRNLNAVHLAQGKTSMVGIVLPTINHPYFASLLQGMAEEAKQHNIQLVMFQTEYKQEKELDALEQLRGNLIDGVICSRAVQFELLLNYKETGPIVLCEDADQEVFPSVSIEHVKAFNQGLDFLIANGHRKIAVCLGRLEGTNSIKRISAYQSKLETVGEIIKDFWILDQCLLMEDGKKVIQRYLGWEEKPTAFLVGNDQVAVGMMAEARRKGVRIPEDLALLSFDNHPVSEIFNLTTIDIPAKELGHTAFRAFLSRSANAQYNEKIILPFNLIHRTSV